MIKFKNVKVAHMIMISFLILFMIVVMLFVGGLASGTCSAAGNSQEVRVGSELDFPPYAFVDESGQIAGFSIELIKAVTDAMGLSIKISTGAWGTVWSSLVAGRLDVLPIVAKLPERQHLVDFSLPHTETYDAFFVRKGDSPIPNIAAARGKAMVVMRSDAAHHELLKRNFQGNLILVDTIPAGLLLISSGKHDAFLCSKLIGTLSIKKHGLTGLTAGPTIPDYKRAFSFAVKKGDKELLEKLNQGLLIVKTNGEYDRIYDKWLSFDDPWRKVQKYLLPVIISVIAIAVIAGFWLVTLQRLVRKRTRELAEKNKKLLHAYDDLEARVQERTVELAQSNQLLQAEIIERKKTEEALRESEERFRKIFEEAHLAIVIASPSFAFEKANPAFCRMMGYSADELRSMTFADITHPDHLNQDVENVKKVGRGEMPFYQTEKRYIHKSGKVLWGNLIVSSIRDEHGALRYYLSMLIDITERKQAEEKIQASLLEKETMLKEIHHRVKNNLQVISSLLGLQSSYLQDEKSREIFQESQDRVKIMADIHTMLYQSEDLARVDFGGFIRDLVGRVQQSYGIPGSSIEVHMDIADVSLTIETSIPCGLILNELVSNALKHAFPEGRGGEVNIRMATAGDQFVLKVQDNGIGFPGEVDFRKTQSLGLELVNLLVGQMNGAIDLEVDGGTTFTITFPTISKGG